MFNQDRLLEKIPSCPKSPALRNATSLPLWQRGRIVAFWRAGLISRKRLDFFFIFQLLKSILDSTKICLFNTDSWKKFLLAQKVRRSKMPPVYPSDRGVESWHFAARVWYLGNGWTFFWFFNSCESVKVCKCESVKVWKCDSVKVWQCESKSVKVKVWK